MRRQQTWPEKWCRPPASWPICRGIRVIVLRKDRPLRAPAPRRSRRLHSARPRLGTAPAVAARRDSGYSRRRPSRRSAKASWMSGRCWSRSRTPSLLLRPLHRHRPRHPTQTCWRKHVKLWQTCANSCWIGLRHSMRSGCMRPSQRCELSLKTKASALAQCWSSTRSRSYPMCMRQPRLCKKHSLLNSSRVFKPGRSSWLRRRHSRAAPGCRHTTRPRSLIRRWAAAHRLRIPWSHSPPAMRCGCSTWRNAWPSSTARTARRVDAPRASGAWRRASETSARSCARCRVPSGASRARPSWTTSGRPWRRLPARRSSGEPL
mmetsp:Transcript_22289/g.62540  ORF Transcript_22289/g.62540 Transcript_22289/m.62540 type:complete len:319 (+) Transcript_22289:381-1337(+)